MHTANLSRPEAVRNKGAVWRQSTASFAQFLQSLGPGLGACLAVSGAASLLAYGQQLLFGSVFVEELVLALVLGAGAKTVLPHAPSTSAGVHFCTEPVLDTAVMLMGCSISVHMVLGAGYGLPLAIAALVGVSLICSYGVGRLLGLSPHLAVLIACGNAICGNSAIASVAPVIGAKGEDVTASISFTAILGLALVLVLPACVPLLHMPLMHYAALAGLTVYAVPQVMVATTVFGPSVVQFATLVKLTRVLMLGPVVLVLAAFTHKGLFTKQPEEGGKTSMKARLQLHHCVPWFIVGFLGLAVLRSCAVLPPTLVVLATQASKSLTILAMAGLGLSTNIRSVAACGVRTSLAVTLSLGLLLALSYAFVACWAV